MKTKHLSKYIPALFMSLSAALILTACHQTQTDKDYIAVQSAPVEAAYDSRVEYAPEQRQYKYSSSVGLVHNYNATYSAPETAQYKNYDDNPIKQVKQEPVTTFSLDVDTGSYANARRFINEGRMPPPDAVRVEELINYFPPASQENMQRLGKAPFSVNYEMAPSPWNADKTLLRVNIQAVDVDMKELPPAHLVFLVDVSGSMRGTDRLDLLKASLKILVEELRPQDKVSLVTYASGTRVVLEPTSGTEKTKIRAALDQLQAGGSTAGAAGITLAYQMAEQGYIKGSVNRILLATDGDFNVGLSNTEELKAMVARAREKGITLSTLGFGTSNYNEAMMVQIADIGNGNYSYIDSLGEAQKVLREEMRATLVTVAKDFKAQIEFNPAQILEYRQIGYEKRQLKNEDFNDDKVDAGDIGAGKRITVLYELTLADGKPSVDPLRYQEQKPAEESNFNKHSKEIAFLKLRWKAPHGDKSQRVELPLEKTHLSSNFNEASVETRFLAAVSAYGQKLRNNPQLADTSWEQIAKWADNAKGTDPNGYRVEFVKLLKLANSISKGQ